MNFKEDLKKLNIELTNEAFLNFEEYYKFLERLHLLIKY